MHTVVNFGLSIVSVPSDSSSVKHSLLDSLTESSTMSMDVHCVESVLLKVNVPLLVVKSSDAEKLSINASYQFS